METATEMLQMMAAMSNNTDKHSYDMSKSRDVNAAIDVMLDESAPLVDRISAQRQLNNALLEGVQRETRIIATAFADSRVSARIIAAAQSAMKDSRKYNMMFVQMQHVACAAILMSCRLGNGCQAEVLYWMAKVAPLDKAPEHLNDFQDGLADDAVGGVVSTSAACLKYLQTPRKCEVFMKVGERRGDFLRVLCGLMGSEAYSYVVRAHAASCFLELLQCDGAREIMLKEKGLQALISTCRSFQVFTGASVMGYASRNLTPDEQRAQAVMLHDPHLMIPLVALQLDQHNPAQPVIYDEAIFALVGLNAFHTWANHWLKPMVLWSVVREGIRFCATVVTYLSRAASGKLKKLGRAVVQQIPLEVMERLALVDLGRPWTCYMRTESTIVSFRGDDMALVANTLAITLAWVRLDPESAINRVACSVPLLRLLARGSEELDLTIATDFVRTASTIPRLLSAVNEHVSKDVVRRYLGAEYDKSMKHMQSTIPEGKRMCSNTGCESRSKASASSAPSPSAFQKLKMCSRCRGAWYCSDTCQIAHWKAGHSKLCAIIRENCSRSAIDSDGS